MNEIEPHLSVLTTEPAYKSEAEQDKQALAAAEAALRKPTKIVDDPLSGRGYLLGDRFTIANLNVAGLIYPGPPNGYDLTPFPNVSTWFERDSGWAIVALQSAANPETVHGKREKG